MTSVLVSAGEASGDRIAAPVVAELARRLPGAAFFGAGGPALRALGVEIRHDIADLAVTGLDEAVGRAGQALAMLGDLGWQAWIRRPALALLVDYPGINLRLATLMQALKIPVLYYVAPQRWAWMPGRARPLRRCIQTLCVTLPFEEAWFRRRGVDAQFVGHPLLDRPPPPPRDQARADLGVTSSDTRVLALLPGSRPNEVLRHLPRLRAALALLPPGIQPVLALLPGEQTRLCQALCPGLPGGETDRVLAAADAALCASGTATLEAALAGVPTAVFYRLSPLSYAVGQRLVRVPFVALPNLLLDRPVLPELLQGAMTPAALAAWGVRLMDPDVAGSMRKDLAAIRPLLGPPGAAARVADLGLRLITRGRPDA